jgi:hypothetical protein
MFVLADRDSIWNKATILIFLITLAALIIIGCARNHVSTDCHAQLQERGRGRRLTWLLFLLFDCLMVGIRDAIMLAEPLFAEAYQYWKYSALTVLL